MLTSLLVHLSFYKDCQLLNLYYYKDISRMNKKSPNITVLSEFGRYPLYVNVLVSTFKFLQRLSTTQSILLQGAYIESCIAANQ